MIRLNDINVYFTDKNGKRTHAVQDASLNINKGEIFGIIGYSGAGKSTLVRVINLLQAPFSGTVHVNNFNLLSLSPVQLRERRKKIGMIFQGFNLMNSRTVYDNILYPLRNTAHSYNEKNKKVLELLKLVGLDDKKDFYPSQLSGGQKQRVAIARALANDPEILLCDEATSALDPKNTQSTLSLLKRLNEQFGLTIVIITHEMQIIKEICNRVAVMEMGRIIEQGKVTDIFRKPGNPLTKEFIHISSHVEQAREKVLRHSVFSLPIHDGNIFLLEFTGGGTLPPFINNLYSMFNIETIILSSNIEIIQESFSGYIIVRFQNKACHEKIDGAKIITYLSGEGVSVTQLNINSDSITRHAIYLEKQYV